MGLAALAFVGVVLAVGMGTTVNLSRSWWERKTVEADESAYKNKLMKGCKEKLMEGNENCSVAAGGQKASLDSCLRSR
jgi:hypothetical protein